MQRPRVAVCGLCIMWARFVLRLPRSPRAIQMREMRGHVGARKNVKGAFHETQHPRHALAAPWTPAP
ncbi:hypothetical protein M3J09_009478 [Ascochyta lentis]